MRKAPDDIDEASDEPFADFIKALVIEAEEKFFFLESHLEGGDIQ